MNEEEIYKMLLKENVDRFPLLNEIFAIRNNKFKKNDYTIYVTGCISLDVINRAIEKVNLIEKLQKEKEELKEENITLEGNKIGYKLAIQELKENQVKQDKVINLMAKKIKAQDPFASVLDIDEKIIIGNFYKKVEEEK